MVGRFILALDQGTTNTKAILVDDAGKIVFRASAPVRTATFSDGRVEQDANHIWDASRQVIQACCAAANAGDIAAIGIANQRETVVLWDRHSGEPVAPAIVWQCRRTAARCAQLARDGKEPFIYLGLSSSLGVDVVEYPDTGKVACAVGAPPDGKRFVFDGKAQVDYWEGEK